MLPAIQPLLVILLKFLWSLWTFSLPISKFNQLLSSRPHCLVTYYTKITLAHICKFTIEFRRIDWLWRWAAVLGINLQQKKKKSTTKHAFRHDEWDCITTWCVPAVLFEAFCSIIPPNTDDDKHRSTRPRIGCAQRRPRRYWLYKYLGIISVWIVS